MMLRQIQHFQAIVQQNSFTEAAELCHISQSGISRSIQALEDEIGAKLIVRKNRSFELTEAGEHFYKKSPHLRLTARSPADGYPGSREKMTQNALRKMPTRNSSTTPQPYRIMRSSPVWRSLRISAGCR